VEVAWVPALEVIRSERLTSAERTRLQLPEKTINGSSHFATSNCLNPRG
jgi:hypothetical protein